MPRRRDRVKHPDQPPSLKMLIPRVGGEFGEAGGPPHAGARLPVVRPAGVRPDRRQVQPQKVGQRHREGLVQPAKFAELPALNGDNLDPRLHGGDLSVQACADDPQVCYHATRNLTRLGRNIVAPFWQVLGTGDAAKARLPTDSIDGAAHTTAAPAPMRFSADRRLVPAFSSRNSSVTESP